MRFIFVQDFFEKKDEMIKRIIKYYRQIVIRRQFKGADLDDVVFGPELDRWFEVRCPEKLHIGHKTVIAGDLFINARGGVTIGKYCHIAKGLTVYSHNHNWKSTESIPYDEKIIEKPVSVGDCVWIGCNVTIAPGAKIGDGVVVSAGSVVFGDIPKCAIVRGNPAEIIGYRDTESFDILYRLGRFV